MAAVAPYTTGTATVTSGSAVVTGTGTAWNIGVVNGGVFFRNGLGAPIASVDSATQLTLATNAPAGMAGTGTYAIDLARAGAADAVTANARLAELVAQLQGISAFAQTTLDDPDAATFRATIGAVGGNTTSAAAADILTKLKTVDGSASGLDADLVRGTIPLATGLGVLNSASTLSAQQSLGFKPLAALTLDDDTQQAYSGASFSNMSLGGMIFIFGNTISCGQGMLYLRTGGASFQLATVGTSYFNLDVQNGVAGSVAGTTDGMLGVSLDTSGTLRIVNRTGATRSFYFFTLHGN